MTLQSWIGVIAGICALAGCIPYWWAIIQRKTRPNRATWLIWLVVGTIIALSYQSAGAASTIWVPITYILGPLVTSVLGIKFGEGGWTKFDRLCLLSAAVSLLFWKLSDSPDLTLVINIGIDLLGALPTIRKSYYQPEGEDLLAWGLFTVANTLNILAIDRWLWQITIYPLYMSLLSGIIFYLLWQGRRKQRKSI